MAHTQRLGQGLAVFAVVLSGLLLGVLCRQAQATVPTDPPVFTNPLDITNPFLPFTPGAVKTFAGVKEKQQQIVVDIYTADTRTFTVSSVDVECRVLQETEFMSGTTAEISRNYFAQGDDGAVYYFGEVVDVYEGGAIVSHEGSWLVGGATLPEDPEDTANASAPGLYMPPNPQVGDTFKPEDLYPIVDETVQVVNTGLRVKVFAGRFEGAIQTRETSQLDPGFESKWYVPGIGVVSTQTKGEWLKLTATTYQPE